MSKTHQVWMERASKPQDIITYVAVNNVEQQEQLKSIITNESVNIHVSGDVVGVTNACDYLTHLPELDGNDNDIVILASDDMYAPPLWDKWITDNLKEPYKALMVNDGYIKQNNITIPIMTMDCLKMLNRIIYHKSYKHSYSDTELYDNLKSMKILHDLWSKSPIFEHKNWANNKRKSDIVDTQIRSYVNSDAENWNIRKKLSLPDRLK